VNLIAAQYWNFLKKFIARREKVNEWKKCHLHIVLDSLSRLFIVFAFFALNLNREFSIQKFFSYKIASFPCAAIKKFHLSTKILFVTFKIVIDIRNLWNVIIVRGENSSPSPLFAYTVHKLYVIKISH
jgi:hypothetical protein